MAKNQKFQVSKHTNTLAIVESKNKKFVIVCANYQVSSREFDSVKQAEEYIGQKPYELLINIMFTVTKLKNQEDEQGNKEVAN